jgi:hypothetical protein
MPIDRFLRPCVRTLLLLGFVATALAGCAQTKVTTTSRTGAEQLLISNSVDQALNKIDWTPLRDRSVYLDEKYIDCVDKAYIIGSVRHRIATAGGQLAAKPDESQVVLEIRSGGVGTDTSDTFVGVPGVTVPGLFALPDVRFVAHQQQTGTAKLGLVAYDAKTMKVLGDGGVSLARSDNNNWYVLGTGPFQHGTIRKEITRATTGVGQFERTEVPELVTFRVPVDAENASGKNNPFAAEFR